MNEFVISPQKGQGYERGKGLGKNLQGISTPVQAVLRKGRGAIGLYGPEKSERAEKDFPTKPTSDEEEEKDFHQKLQRWKKGKVVSLPSLFIGFFNGSWKTFYACCVAAPRYGAATQHAQNAF